MGKPIAAKITGVTGYVPPRVQPNQRSPKCGTTKTMPATTSYSFGEIVLVPFPFTDQTGIKKRPAVIVSSAAYNVARRIKKTARFCGPFSLYGKTRFRWFRRASFT